MRDRGDGSAPHDYLTVLPRRVPPESVSSWSERYGEASSLLRLAPVSRWLISVPWSQGDRRRSWPRLEAGSRAPILSDICATLVRFPSGSRTRTTRALAHAVTSSPEVDGALNPDHTDFERQRSLEGIRCTSSHTRTRMMRTLHSIASSVV